MLGADEVEVAIGKARGNFREGEACGVDFLVFGKREIELPNCFL